MRLPTFLDPYLDVCQGPKHEPLFCKACAVNRPAASEKRSAIPALEFLPGVVVCFLRRCASS